MTEAECKRQAVGALLAQAQSYEKRAESEVSAAGQMRFRGRALQSRGSAWVMQAELMEEKAAALRVIESALELRRNVREVI